MKKYESLMKWIPWFFMKNVKVSILLIVFFFVAWSFSLRNIAKESFPDIKFWIISVSTIYQWANPEDIDSLITDKIEWEIRDIDWIKKISSSSSVWVSSIVIELRNWVNTNDVLNEVKDKVQKIQLPQDAKDPIITEISGNSSTLYQVLLYWDSKSFSHFDLTQKAKELQAKIQWSYNISKVDIWATMWKINNTSNFSSYEIKVLLDKNKIELLWLSVAQIANTISSFNKNVPIWNYKIWNLNYDFRIDWELSNIRDLENIIIRSDWVSSVRLKDIASFKKEYKDKSKNFLWSYKSWWFTYVSMIFNKEANVGIFEASRSSKKALNEIIKNDKSFSGLNIAYVNDMANIIINDYKSLWNTAIQTIILVFAMIFLFIWARESVIVSLIFPLAFLITFMFLNFAWYSLNFLTNFSLILTLWISVDVIIVIVQWATDKMRLGYPRVPAVMMAINDFKAPLISWTLTTLSAFLPMMFLPWVMWKFLSYIPITVFITLLACLFLSLTISSVFFITFIKSNPNYQRDEKIEETLNEKEKEFLKEWRNEKTEISTKSMNLREKILYILWKQYYFLLWKFIKNKLTRTATILSPIVLLVLSFIFLAPRIWFNMFPATDQWMMSIKIEWRVWTTTDMMSSYVPIIEKNMKKYKEIKVFYISVNRHNIDLKVELKPLLERRSLWEKSIFEIEASIEKDMNQLRSLWLKASVVTAKNWPPSWAPIWVKLIANSSKYLNDLKKVSEDFENFLQKVPWTKNVGTSSTQTPWQFVFKFDREKLTSMWLSPSDISRTLYLNIAWMKAWSIKSRHEDNDILVKIKDFDDKLIPSNIQDMTINTKSWPIKLWNILDYSFKQSVDSIKREDWKILISVESDFLPWYNPWLIQPKLSKFAEEYKYPVWVSYNAWWESAENRDLIFATISSFFIAIFLIFSILVFQFNSFIQPVIILYSIVLAVLWVNVWLFLTWNPYSMTFGIWFLALTWIVVNNAIVLIDKMNNNLKKWIDLRHSILNAWRSRLQPILVTTMTTVFGVLPLAMQDQFWAWLWYTLAFWLLAWSLMTLFVIPVLYYGVNRRKYR